MSSSCTFFAVKVDGSDVIAGISLYENLFTDSRYDITSINFNSEKVHEDDIFVRQDILQFFSPEFKISIDVIRTLKKFSGMHFSAKKFQQ